jgi:FkbM family methyltransferase
MVNMVIVGANIGKSHTDVAWIQVRKNDWRGLFVEPLPQSFEKLKEYYSDIEGNYFEQAAVLPDILENKDRLSEGSTALYYDPDCTVVASTDPSTYDPVLGRDMGIRNNYMMDVPAMTLLQLIEKYNLIDVEFDLLQLDVEGADISILKSTDFTHILPKYIRVETVRNLAVEINNLTTYLEKWNYVKLERDPFWAEYAKITEEPELERFNTVYKKEKE